MLEASSFSGQCTSIEARVFIGLWGYYIYSNLYFIRILGNCHLIQSRELYIVMYTEWKFRNFSFKDQCLTYRNSNVCCRDEQKPKCCDSSTQKFKFKYNLFSVVFSGILYLWKISKTSKCNFVNTVRGSRYIFIKTFILRQQIFLDLRKHYWSTNIFELFQF